MYDEYKNNQLNHEKTFEEHICIHLINEAEKKWKIRNTGDNITAVAIRIVPNDCTY